MATLLDLNLLPVARFAGSDHAELLGLHAAEPPRRTARGKGNDRLALYLAVIGNAPLPPAKQERLLADLASLYYETPGSVTSSMRTVVEAMNEVLLERNLRIANSGRQGIGLFTQFVLRDDQLYLALSGPIHAYLIAADGVRQFYTQDMEGRGLGQSRTPPVSYQQAQLQAGDTLLFAAQPGPDWNVSTLAGLHGQGPQSLRRKLFPQTIDVNAVLIQARPGRGRFYLPRLQPASTGAIQAADQGDDLGLASMPTVQPSLQTDSGFAPMEAGEAILATETLEGVQGSELLAQMSSPGQTPASGEDGFPAPVARAARPKRTGPRLNLAPLWKALASVGLPILNVFQRLGRGLVALVERLLPEGVSSSVMAFIAIAVPVVIVTVASVAYHQLGRAAQYDALYSQAQQIAEQAMGRADLQARRSDWEQVLLLLREIEMYRVTPETQALREQAVRDLDEMNLVRRVDYQPAIADQLPPAVNITRVVISDEDLYLVDGNSGNVVHAVPAEQGYSIDQAFQCGPGPVGVSQAGNLIDIVPWPAGFTPEASILALDDRGNAIYCGPNQTPKIDPLTPSTSQSWGKPTAITLDSSDLYVLDPTANAVWIYWGSDVLREPSLFFDQEIPDLQDVIDLTANNGELYLLHADGHVTLCYLGTTGVSPTRCSDPPYIDERPGMQGLSLVTPSPFTQIAFTPPPDPSLFLLEPENHAIYHFSLRNLVFKRQYLPEEPLSSRPATAFFVHAARRMLFLAIGNEVYYGIAP